MFFVGDQLLPSDTPIEHFQYATQIVPTLDIQKNYIRCDTVSHFRLESPSACPVLVGVNIFLCMREQGCPATTPVSNYPTNQGLRSVRISNIIFVIRADTHRVGAARLGLSPEDVGTHSLCYGGSMAMLIVGSQIRPSWPSDGGTC